jgi:hypothetical protein
MRFDKCVMELRPRGAYEATDLGVRMIQDFAPRVYAAWFAVVVPFALACLALLPIAGWLPAVAIWWLKPLYDRVVLYVLSRAVFGDDVGIRQVVAGWREILGNGLFGALTFRRFDLARSFTLPLFLLEGVKGKRRRERNKVLQRLARSPAVVMHTAYFNMEQSVYLGILGLMFLMLPTQQYGPIFSALFSEESSSVWLNLASCAIYIAAMSFVEPFYVAAGFSLYLNRRVELEAWDIEMSLRRALAKEALEPSPAEALAA